MNISRTAIDDLIIAIKRRAQRARDDNTIMFANVSDIRDIDSLVEDIESGILEISDITEEGSMNEYFILGKHGFTDSWVLG